MNSRQGGADKGVMKLEAEHVMRDKSQIATQRRNLDSPTRKCGAGGGRTKRVRFSGRCQFRSALWIKAFLIFVYVLAPALVPAQSLVRLLREASVESDRVLLADLLPPGASPTLKSMAEKINLGRAPQVGSFRVFHGGEI